MDYDIIHIFLIRALPDLAVNEVGKDLPDLLDCEVSTVSLDLLDQLGDQESPAPPGSPGPLALRVTKECRG